MIYSELSFRGMRVNAYDVEMNTCCDGKAGNYKNVR